jgi:hypothetical protein
MFEINFGVSSLKKMAPKRGSYVKDCMHKLQNSAFVGGT